MSNFSSGDISCMKPGSGTTFRNSIRSASAFRITVLLSKDFLRLVMVAVVIGSPIAWYIMQQWLQRYSYNIGLHAWVFVMAAVGVLLLSLFTISYQALKAAMANPVKSLKTE